MVGDVVRVDVVFDVVVAVEYFLELQLILDVHLVRPHHSLDDLQFALEQASELRLAVLDEVSAWQHKNHPLADFVGELDDLREFGRVLRLLDYEADHFLELDDLGGPELDPPFSELFLDILQ